MPILMSDPIFESNRLAVSADPNIRNLSDAISRPTDPGMFQMVGGVLGMGIVDLVDTVASSVPGINNLTGANRGDINQGVLRLIDSPGLNQFYQEYKGGAEAVSGIAGIVAADLVARRVTAPASVFTRAISRVPYVRRIAALDEEFETAMRGMRAVDMGLARRGALGAEQYAGRVTLNVSDDAARSIVIGDVTRAQARSQVMGAAMRRGAWNVARTEAVMALTLNQNGFLYVDDMSHNLAFAAFGMGLGAGVERAFAGYSMRKFVNSDEVRRTFAGALDPAGDEEARLLWHRMNPSAERLATEGEQMGFAGGSFTDQVTNLLISRNARVNTPVSGDNAASLLANRDRLATQDLQLARETLNKVTVRGDGVNGFTRFDVSNGTGYGAHINQLLTTDPGAFYLAESIAAVPEEYAINSLVRARTERMTERLTEFEEFITKQTDLLSSGKLSGIKLEEAARDLSVAKDTVNRLRFLRDETVPVPYIDGEAVTLSDAAAFDNWIEPIIDSARTADNGLIWQARTEAAAAKVGIDNNLNLYLPDNIALRDADHFDMLRLYRAGNQAVRHFTNAKNVMQVPDNPNWFQLDLAEEVLRRNPNASVQFPAGMTRETAQVESFAQKALEIREVNKTLQKTAGKRIGGIQQPTEEEMLSRLRIKFNLPRLTAYERGILADAEHPVESILRGVSEWGGDVRKLGLQEVKEAVAKHKRIGDFAQVTAKDIDDLRGNSFTFLTTKVGDSYIPTKPLIMYKRSFQPHEWTRDNLAERLATRKMVIAQRLMGEGSTPLNTNLTKALFSSPDFDQAARTHELMETQIQASMVGANNQSLFGAIGNSLKSREWIDRDSPILLAASRLQRTVQTFMRGELSKNAQQAFGDTLTRLDSPRHAETKMLLNQFHSFRSGWHLATNPRTGMPDIVTRQGPNGQTLRAFILQNNPQNRERFAAQFGKEMSEGQTLISPNGKEVVLDDLGFDIQTRYNQLTEWHRGNQNSLLKARDMRQIQPVPMYVPAPNTSGKFIGHIYGPDGKIVPGSAVIANTQSEFARLEEAAMKRIGDELGLGYTFRTQDDVRRFASIWDRAEMDMVDPGLTAIAGGKRATGANTAAQYNPQAFEASLKVVQDRILDHGNDILETLMRDQINSARARMNVSAPTTRNRAGFFRDQQFRNIHGHYLENLLGTSPLSSSGSLVGRLYNTVEGGIDQALAATTRGSGRERATLWKGMNEWIDRRRGVNLSQADKDFNVLVERLGAHNPFENVAEMIASRGGGTMPKTAMGLVGSINSFTTTMMLRALETMQPVMNLAGMVNAMPAVIRHIAPRAGESAAEYGARVGHSATVFDLGADKAGRPRFTGILDITKIGSRAFRNAMRPGSHADWEIMSRHGYLDGNVAEILKDYASLQTRAQWETTMGKITDRVSILTDKSEDFSRAWGHFIGLDIAQQLGITNKMAQHQFAHDIANKMIANYAPHNRAEVFQGALGAPIGLFQSWIINYYQRMFRYVETKDFRALGTQMMTQGSLFGVTTIPGWSAMQGALNWANDEDVELSDGMQQRFGASGTSVLMGGVLGNIPTLFGADAVDLTSRGDVQFRVPGVNPPPALTMAEKILTGIGQGVGMFWESNPGVSGTQIAEILSNMIPNRPMSGIIEQVFAGGNDTDWRGQLVTDTRTWSESVYRMLGVRSERQAVELQAFYANKSAMEQMGARNDILRVATRSAIRAQNWDALPGIYEQYIMNGGDPRQFRRWIRLQFESATSSRAERQLNDVIRDPEKMRMVTRLLDAGVGIRQDDEVQDDYSSIREGTEVEGPGPMGVRSPGSF